MNERWVCKRCFADNEETDGTCVRCGLTRGAESTTADQATWAPPVGAATTAAPGWRRWIRFWWIPAIAIFLVVGYLTSVRRDGDGAIVAGGTVPVNEVRVGDCFNAAEEAEISEVQGIPCTEPHAYELFHIATWSGSSGFPTDEAMFGFVAAECLPVFEAFVGRSYEASILEFVHLSPSPDGWDAGDRDFPCMLVDPAEPEVTGSLRGADR